MGGKKRTADISQFALLRMCDSFLLSSLPQSCIFLFPSWACVSPTPEVLRKVEIIRLILTFFFTDSLPVTEIDPNSEPSFEVLGDLSKEITTVWESIGRHLELEEAKIECIRENNVQCASPEQKAFEVLNAWRQKGTSVTYKELGRVLKHLGKTNLAQKYCEAGK